MSRPFFSKISEEKTKNKTKFSDTPVLAHKMLVKNVQKFHNFYRKILDIMLQKLISRIQS